MDSESKASVDRPIRRDLLVLRRTIHDLMNRALEEEEAHCPDDAREAWLNRKSVRGQLFLCLVRLEAFSDQEEARAPDGRLLGIDHSETVQVSVFRSCMLNAARLVRSRYGGAPLKGVRRRINSADVSELEHAFQAAREALVGKDHARNKRMRVQHAKNAFSIQGYVRSLLGDTAVGDVECFELSLNAQQRDTLASIGVEGFTAVAPIRFPQDYIADFARVSGFVALLKKVWPDAIRGHLVKLLQHTERFPVCLLVLFWSANARLERVDIHRAWKQHLFGRESDLNAHYHAPGLYHVKQFSANPSERETREAEVEAWVQRYFIDDLQYQRLALPSRRRSWSRGVLPRDIARVARIDKNTSR